MNQQTDDRDAAEIADTVRQSELIAALGVNVVCPACKRSYETSGCHECPYCCHEWDDGEPYCFAHGEPVAMLPRPLIHQSPEQKACGKWYDCPKCSNATLFPSTILLNP